MIDKTQTMSFIHRRELPANKRATYIRVVCADRPEKDNPRRVRWTIGGDRIVYPGNKSTKTADLVTVKLLLNSTISTRGGRFMTLDLSDFYLYSVLPDPEYVRIPLTLLPPAVIERYNLQDKIYQGHVYARVDKGMYGLPQAGKLETLRVARDLLLEQLDGGVRWFTIDGREGRMREANGRLGVGHGWRWSAVGVFSLILETLEHFYFKKNSRGATDHFFATAAPLDHVRIDTAPIVVTSATGAGCELDALGRTAGCSRLVARKVSATEPVHCDSRLVASAVLVRVGVGRQSTCSSGPRPGSIGRTAGCSRLVARKVSATEPVHCDSRLVASAVLVRVGVGRQSTCSSGPRPGSIGRTAGCSRLVARKVCCNRTGALRFAARGECSVG